ncbi:hypothetical protein [Streptomyces sp. NPDC020667]|uniref:hypothetical protein n=1 Tax=Streptomyces sp. NPDC020667 TaxID=3154895 RepID=UPI00340D0EF7
MTNNPEIQVLLDRSVQKVQRLHGALIVSNDGLLQYSSGFDGPRNGTEGERARVAEAERRAAAVSALSMSATHVAKCDGAQAAVRTMVEADGGLYLIGSTGKSHVIALFGDGDAEPGDLGYELAFLAQELGVLLDAGRHSIAVGGAA